MDIKGSERDDEMGNMNDRSDDGGQKINDDCVTVLSRCGKRTHWVRSEDLQQLQGLSESEFQR